MRQINEIRCDISGGTGHDYDTAINNHFKVSQILIWTLSLSQITCTWGEVMNISIFNYHLNNYMFLFGLTREKPSRFKKKCHREFKTMFLFKI